MMADFTIQVFEEDKVEKISGTCQRIGCNEKANTLVQGRERIVVHMCDKHANELVDERNPEYCVFCPNCGCMFGVN